MVDAPDAAPRVTVSSKKEFENAYVVGRADLKVPVTSWTVTKRIDREALSPDRAQVCLVSSEAFGFGEARHFVTVYSSATGRVLYADGATRGSPHHASCVAFSPDGRLLAVGVVGGRVRLPGIPYESPIGWGGNPSNSRVGRYRGEILEGLLPGGAQTAQHGIVKENAQGRAG